MFGSRAGSTALTLSFTFPKGMLFSGSAMKRIVVAGVALGAAVLTGCGLAAQAAGLIGSGELRQIAIKAERVPLDPRNPAVTRIGRLRYMGGIALSSSDREFGGFSALLWDGDCNRLLAASDTGVFLALRIEEDADGKLTGASEAWLAPVLGTDGKPAPTKVAADSESLSRDGDHVLLWFEQDPRAQRYPGLTPCRPETMERPAYGVTRIPAMKKWPVNGGPEAVANLGSLQVVISEQQPSGKKGREALAAYGGRVLRHFRYIQPAGHDPSALDRLSPDSPDRHFVALNRKFSILGGFSVIVTEFELPRDDGVTVRPATVAWLKYPYTVDNFEGLAVRQEGVRRFLYLISDDNFVFFQRTLLLKFELLPGPDDRKETGEKSGQPKGD